MNTQQIQNTLKNAKSTGGNIGLWLGLGLLLIVAALAIQNVSRRVTIASIPNTGAGAPAVQVQSVPDASAQGVTNYINAHSGPSAQSVPEAGVQGVAGYINAHSNPSVQSVPDASVQSVADYLRLHSNDLGTTVITDPAVQSVMDYLKAHGLQP
jgi:hypothetical protein